MKHLLKMSDLTREELFHILDVADELKADRKAGRVHPLLAGKSLALIFAKPSTRTRASFQVGMYQLGGLAHYLNAVTEMQLGYGEAIEDTARTLGRYYDGIMIRTYKQSDAEALAQWSGVPVINGLTDYAHPCQVLADLMTIREKKGRLEGQKLWGASRPARCWSTPRPMGTSSPSPPTRRRAHRGPMWCTRTPGSAPAARRSSCSAAVISGAIR